MTPWINKVVVNVRKLSPADSILHNNWKNHWLQQMSRHAWCDNSLNMTTNNIDTEQTIFVHRTIGKVLTCLNYYKYVLFVVVSFFLADSCLVLIFLFAYSRWLCWLLLFVWYLVMAVHQGKRKVVAYFSLVYSLR